MWGSGWLATFLLFCAWLLQLFTIIGGLDNLPFLNEAYYTRVQTNNQANRFYLWNQCSEDPLGTVNQCSHPVAGYEWGTLPPYNTVPGVTGHSKTFFALSAVTWIAFGITTLTLLSSLITHCCCCKRMTSRWFDFNHFWWAFIAWLAQLAAFILAIVFGTRGGNLLENGLSNTSYSLGPNTWMSLGAFLALTLSLMMFCCGFCIGRKRKNGPAVEPTYDDQPQYAQGTKEKRGWFGRKKQTPAQDPEMAYNSTGAYNNGAYDTPGAAGAGSGAYDNSGNTGSAYDSTQNNPHTGAKAAAAGAAGVAAGAYGAKKYNQSGNYDNSTSGGYGNKNYDTTTGAPMGAAGTGTGNYGGNTGGAYGTGTTGNYDTTTGAPIGAATGAAAGAYGAGSTGNYNNNATRTTGAYGDKTYDDTAAGTTGAYGAGNTTGNYNNAATAAGGTGSYGNPQTTTGGAYNNDTGVDNDSSVYHTPATGYEPGTNPGGTAYQSGTGVYDTAADGYNNLSGYNTNSGSAANDTSNNVRV